MCGRLRVGKNDFLNLLSKAFKKMWAERKRGSKRRSVIKEAKNYSIVQSDETTELSYLVLSVPKNLSYDEKMRRLALLADKVTGLEDSDAICIAAWVPSESEQ
jgi:hypothetical protein